MKVDENLLLDLPNMEILSNGQTSYYKTISIEDNELCLINILDYDDELYIPLKNLSNHIDNVGHILNYNEYIYSLEEIFEYREVIVSKNNKKFQN